MDAEVPISPEELGIPKDDLEKPPLEAPKQPDQLDHDSESNVVLAEDIAQFRTDLEQKIFFERLPRGEWEGTYEEALANYPQAQPYKDVFEEVLKAAERCHDDLRAFWILQNGSSESGEVASPEISAKIFESILGFNPKGEVTATKGIVSLKLEVDDAVFKQFYTHAGRAFDENETAFTVHPTSSHSYPVIVSRKSLSGEDSFYALRHEFEHIKTDIKKAAAQNYGERKKALALLGPERLTLPKAVSDRIERRNKTDSAMEIEAKDEILAYFTEPELLDFPSETKLEEYLDAYSEEIKYLLTHEDSEYFDRYMERFSPSLNEQKTYERNVNVGVDSIVDLFKLYFTVDKDTRKSARMAINVLEQFPLHSWPAVVRLVRERHKST